jgi:hypothetical protein
MMLKVDNHYVPLLYLKRWAGTDRKVAVYRVLVQHANVPLWNRFSIRSIGFHQNLYTRILGGTETDEFENWLEREIETPAEEPIARATANARLTPADWERLIRFLATQDMRTPARMIDFMARQVKELPAATERVLQNVVRDLTEAKRSGKTIERPASDIGAGFPIRVTKEIEPGAELGTLKVETVVGRSLWLWSLKQPLTQTYKVLKAHKWTVVRPPTNMNWLTSDNPVVKLNYYAHDHYDFKGGWGKPGTELIMPLGPQHLLYTKVGERPPWIKGDRVPEFFALAFQRFIIQNAHRYVYAATPDPQVEMIRPRTVNAAAFQHEANQWKKWGHEQSQAERNLNAPAPVQPTVNPT